jgi:Cysteine-rich secretory protein family
MMTLRRRRGVPSKFALAIAFPLASGGALALSLLSGCSSSSSSDDLPPGADDAGSSGSSGGDATAGGSSGGASSGGPGSGGSSGSSDAGAHPDAGSAVPDGGGLVPDGDAGTCAAPAGITTQQATALQIVNSTRAAMGSPCASMVPALNTSASKHCTYYAANKASATCIADPHTEVSSCTDYVAANFSDREKAAGYTCKASATQSCEASEVMAFSDDPTSALGQWIGSIYHRSPLLDPRTRDFGYGAATGCDTIDLGEGAGSTTPSNVIVSYPYDGQTGVGRSFNGNQESPTPPVPPNNWPSAYPIHVYMQATTITLTTDEFGFDGGAQLAHQVITPQSAQGYLVNALVLYGNVPLSAQTKYRVHVAGTRQTKSFSGTVSAPFDVSFAFTTQ